MDKEPIIYKCETCKYSTSRIGNIKSHELSKRHKEKKKIEK